MSPGTPADHGGGRGGGTGGRGGSLVRVASWDLDSLELWPEIVRSPVVFALGVLRELPDHGADAGSRYEVDLVAAAGSIPAAFPAMPAQVNLGG